jgi:hypothetical protein
MLTGYIYCHTNKINGKQYIGQTIQIPEARWNNGLGYKNQRYFYRDIIKYGWENFDHKIIVTIQAPTSKALSKSLNELEGYYILKYESMLADKGYNASVNDSILRTTLSLVGKRIVKKYMDQGKTFQEAIELYRVSKNKKRRW